ncbi:MAG: ABC transporter permease [Candidatus Methanoperedens sp.]|nr:ABC transporter permease [Candidatus Methanoperedens sp.]
MILIIMVCLPGRCRAEQRWCILILLIISIAMVSIGLVKGANLTSPFQSCDTFLMWPMFFFSGALFPVSNLSPWLAAATKINPMTYGVDAMRGIILGINHYSLLLDTAVLMVFTVMMMGIGIISFRRM